MRKERSKENKWRGNEYLKMVGEFYEWIYSLSPGGGGRCWTELCNCHLSFINIAFAFQSFFSFPHSSLTPSYSSKAFRAPWTCLSSFHPPIVSAFLPCHMSLKCNFHRFDFRYLLCRVQWWVLEIQWTVNHKVCAGQDD